MKIDWINSDEYYHVQLERQTDKKEAIKALILKILQLSDGKDDWNSLILDKWVFNLGRLIGNIQNRDEPIGMDKGYRVAIQFLDYHEKLEASDIDEKTYTNQMNTINEEMQNLIHEVCDEPSFKDQLQGFYEKNNFVIEISEQGQRIGLVLSPCK